MSRSSFSLALLSCVWLLAACLGGCGEPVAEASPDRGVAGQAPVIAQPPVEEPEQEPQPSSPPALVEEEPFVACRPVAERLVLCPDAAMVRSWAVAHALPSTAATRTGLTPHDPVAVEDGLVLYERLLRGVVPETRAHLDLWASTPALSAEEQAWFAEHPEVWRDVVRMRSTRPGAARARALGKLLEAWTDDREALRHVVLRGGVVFFDDAASAVLISRRVTLEDLFDAPRLELVRAGERFVLQRGRDGQYYHTGEELAGYRARLHVLDRVAALGALPPVPGYGLASLRRALALDHVEIRAHGARRAATAVMLSGERFEGELVRTSEEEATLVLVATPAAWTPAFAESRHHLEAIERLRASTFAMVRENLFFDEPANEEGQQDGIMRLAFAQAYRKGEVQYEVNGETYDVFDRQGRPRPPQVCVDFITDAVERSAGRWWPRQEAEARGQTPGRIDIRQIMPYRQVWRLVDIPEAHPHVATVRSFSLAERAPFEQTAAFHRQIRAHRDELREADVVVIYGLRDDGRNHYHSFYIHETDPVYGIPTLLVDQAGHARLRPWNVIMRAAPKRSIHHRLRWNPDWLLDPEAVMAAEAVTEQAATVVARVEALW